MNSTMRMRLRVRRPKRKAPLSCLPSPRTRRAVNRLRHTTHEHDISCRGAKRREIVTASEKLMHQLQIENDSTGRYPDLSWVLGEPIIMSDEALAIARKV